MKKIDNLLCNISNESFYKNLTNGRGVFLDIETTGLNKDSCSIYLIGLLMPCEGDNEGSFRLILLFAESPGEELQILSALSEILSGRSVKLITFNGRRFDLPFLIRRYEKHALPVPTFLSDGTDIDIYREIKPYRRSFCLNSLNQKSIEKMLGICREDRYSGKELIEVYKQYVLSGDPGLFDLLITHNRDDVTGMSGILPVLSYVSIFKTSEGTVSHGSFEIKDVSVETHTGFDGQEQSEIIISFSLPCNVPVPHLFHNLRLFLEVNEKNGILHMPLFKGELKHFFDNYRDYRYIPSEDRAVHKDIASIMTSAEYEKAKASNCYIRTEGLFLPLPEGYSFENETVYKADHKSRAEYVLLNDSINTPVKLKPYLLFVLKTCFC